MTNFTALVGGMIAESFESWSWPVFLQGSWQPSECHTFVHCTLLLSSPTAIIKSFVGVLVARGLEMNTTISQSSTISCWRIVTFTNNADDACQRRLVKNQRAERATTHSVLQRCLCQYGLQGHSQYSNWTRYVLPFDLAPQVSIYNNNHALVARSLTE